MKMRTFIKGKTYINNSGIIVKCTKSTSIGWQGIGVVIESSDSLYPVGHKSDTWNIYAFTEFEVVRLSEPTLEVIL